ncbi:hypothetical protein C8R44DRAFT_928204 [Mycena epipterygia]|nr:hypothetical protein C8R44DRAFT_928204 [Mycena epipterygia]
MPLPMAHPPASPLPPRSLLPLCPPPLKRKHDDIVDALRVGTLVGSQAKRRKRAANAVLSTEERLVAIGKYFMRAMHPFMDISEPMLYGPEHHWSTPATDAPSNTVVIPASELARQRLCIAAFDKMFALAPDLLEVIKALFLEESKPEQWNCLVKMLQKAATSARTSDTGGLKHCLDYVVPNPLKHESKSDRGLTHPMLRHSLLPWAERLQLPPLVMPTSEQDGGSSAEPAIDQSVGADSTEPTVPTARNELLDRIVANRLELTAEDFPSFFYAEGSFDPNDLDKGLLRGISSPLDGAKSALFGLSDGRLPPICNARLHGTLTADPEMIGYTGVQARTMLSTAEWKSRDGAYDYEALFTSIVNLFEDPEDPWAKDTLAWYQRMVFDGVTNHSQPMSEPTASASSTVLAQRAARRAAASV